jgi:Tfp pilus assembly PilM family ATPase
VTKELTKYLSSKIGISFIIFNPFDKLTATKRVSESDLYTQKFNSFSSAAGIAYRTA